MNNAEWGALLRAAHERRTGERRNIRLPAETDIRLGGDRQCATVFLTEAASTSNMQTNRAAFEGWSLALMVWGDVQRVELDWQPPTSPEERQRNGHYQRFLYRGARFSELMTHSVGLPPDKQDFADLRLAPGQGYLNIASGKDTADGESPNHSEAAIEKQLVSESAARERLMTMCGLERLDRQFPVGVFEGAGKPTKAAAIFTGGKSAIDLIGTSSDGGLWIFELKRDDNIQVGSASELFFYSMLMRDVVDRRIAFSAGKVGPRAQVHPEHIVAATRVHACLLARQFHPLISDGLLDLLSDQAQEQGWPVDYRKIDLNEILPTAGASANDASR